MEAKDYDRLADKVAAAVENDLPWMPDLTDAKADQLKEVIRLALIANLAA